MRLKLFTSKVFLLFFLLSSCSGMPLRPVHDLRSAASMIDNIKLEKQADKYDCGIASLVSVLDYWNVEAEQSAVSRDYPLRSGKEGYSIVELKNIAKDYNSKAFVLQGNKDFLREQILLGRPVIVPIFVVGSWEVMFFGKRIYGEPYNHYVVAFGFSEDKIWVMDPDKGFKAIPFDRFLKMWEVNDHVCLLVAN